MSDLRDAANRGDSEAVRAALAAIDAEVEAERTARDAEVYPQLVRDGDSLRIRVNRWVDVDIGSGAIGAGMGGSGADATLTAEQWRELATECGRQARFVDDRDGTTPIVDVLISFATAVRSGSGDAPRIHVELTRRIPQGDSRWVSIGHLWDVYRRNVGDRHEARIAESGGE